ncbi:MAG: hypothetical protein Q4E47_03555 [Candidatus Saccharibacteria bacterium]|nr:hypothetical protein [Candidatus Saccharibacteria bacterium]
MKLGKTIVAEREIAETESERAELRTRERKRKNLTLALVVAGFALVIAIVAAVIHQIVVDSDKPVAVIDTTYTPTVEIIDEGDTNYVTDKIKNYVGRIEKDFFDLGYKVSRVVLPTGKTRELDIYLDGRNEYYKCSLDRGTAETAEDSIRMVKYLDDKKISATYVDVRLPERAYFKTADKKSEKSEEDED